MVKESPRLARRLIAKAGGLPPKPSLLPHAGFASAGRASRNYGKSRSIRIDTVTEQTGANSLTGPANLLKNKLALSAPQVGAALEWAAPRGLCGLIRVGA